MFSWLWIGAAVTVLAPSLLLALTRNWPSFAVVLLVACAVLSYLSYEVIQPFFSEGGGGAAEAMGAVFGMAGVVVLIVAWSALLLTAATMAYRIARASRP